MDSKILIKNVTNATANVKSKAGIGTPCKLTFPNILGACPSLDNAYNILVDAYIPELAAEITEVKTTAFITVAARLIPALSKTVVNGLIAISFTSEPSKLGLV